MPKGEKIIFRTQGSLQFRASWQLSHLWLTNRRQVFTHVTKQVFEISLDQISELSVIKRMWMLGVRVKQLCLNYGSGQEPVYIALAEPEKWVEMIKESMALLLAERWGYIAANPEPPGNT